MGNTAFLVAGVLPYVAVVVFLVGVVYRLLTWQRVPQPALMTLYPNQGHGLLPLAKEALFFPSLFRGDRTLWLLAWSFHVALAMAFVGHFRAITGLVDRGLAGLGFDSIAIDGLSAIAGGAAGIILLSTVLLLVARRLLLARVREISTVPDFLALLLLVAVITSGDLMRFGATHVELAQTRTWAASLFTFSPVVPALPGFVLHLFFAELLILHIAFSKLMHFGGFFFTFALIKRAQP
jgi:nitrate reductase gamma subunit